jgi:hypothetical protein
MPFAETAADALKQLHLRPFLPYQVLSLEFYIPGPVDHSDDLCRADQRTLGTPDTLLVRDGNPPPECVRDRYLLFRVKNRDRPGKEVLQHLPEHAHGVTQR